MMTMLAIRCCVSRDPKRRYLDVVKENRQQVGVKEVERLTHKSMMTMLAVRCFKGP